MSRGRDGLGPKCPVTSEFTLFAAHSNFNWCVTHSSSKMYFSFFGQYTFVPIERGSFTQ